MTDAGEQLRILVVTEDRHLAEEAEYSFSAEAEVKIVSDAVQAISEMATWLPSCVVVDLQAGNAGAYALGRDMDEDARFREIPRLVLLERAEDRWLANESGADRIRVKPIGSEELARETLGLLPN